jgi:hypothetical protein
MVSFCDIEVFVQECCGIRRTLKASDRLEEDLGITGDDYFELIDEYSKRFDVNVDGFLWYFHCHEEAFNPGALFFPAPSSQVKRIPITLEHLLAFANSRKWDISYPPHSLARRRYDIYITWLLYLSPVAIAFLLVAFGGNCR